MARAERRQPPDVDVVVESTALRGDAVFRMMGMFDEATSSLS